MTATTQVGALVTASFGLSRHMQHRTDEDPSPESILVPGGTPVVIFHAIAASGGDLILVADGIVVESAASVLPRLAAGFNVSPDEGTSEPLERMTA